MPEEINRIVTDHLSDLLFCPSQTAVKNLAAEGITNGVHLVADVMADALVYNRGIAQRKSRILETLGFADEEYCVLTVHRAGNTDDRQNLTSIIPGHRKAGVPVVFPVYPAHGNIFRNIIFS